MPGWGHASAVSRQHKKQPRIFEKYKKEILKGPPHETYFIALTRTSVKAGHVHEVSKRFGVKGKPKCPAVFFSRLERSIGEVDSKRQPRVKVLFNRVCKNSGFHTFEIRPADTCCLVADLDAARG
jgi:hypothetical protein